MVKIGAALVLLLSSINSMAFSNLFEEQSSGRTPRTVQFVDLNKYLGNWYEIASIPQFFSEGCNCTRAKYGKLRNGNISVLNTCNKGGTKGELSIANGEARVEDKRTNAKLAVNFFGPFWGEYWIVGLDKNFRYSVVSNSDGSSLWILSRTPTLDSALYKEAVTIAKKNGIDVSQMLKTNQNGCKYP